MNRLILSLLAITTIAVADICSDLNSIGVPARDAFIEDGMLVVSMSGSLAQGDSLLKHYGGVFYTVVDSILDGWDVMGITVDLDEAALRFSREDMLSMFGTITETTDDEAIADWVLNHTLVFMKDDEP